MTVCIAAITRGPLVVATDTLISAGQSSLMWFGGKMETEIRGWATLYAGTLADEDILEQVFAADMKNQPDNEPDTVRKSLESSIRAAIPKFLADKFLTPYGIDMETFLHDRSLFTDEMRNELTRQMADYSDRYDPELIVAGWGDTAAKPHPEYGIVGEVPTLFTVNRDGVRSHRKLGFCAIGSGAAAAHASLCFHEYHSAMSVEEAVYYVAAAKFMAERTTGVGPITALWVLEQTGDLWPIADEDIRAIRERWIKRNPPFMDRATGRLLNAVLWRSARNPRRAQNINKRWTKDDVVQVFSPNEYGPANPTKHRKRKKRGKAATS